MKTLILAIVLCLNALILHGTPITVVLPNEPDDDGFSLEIDLTETGIDPAKSYIFAASENLRTWIGVGEPSLVEVGRAAGTIAMSGRLGNDPFFVRLIEVNPTDSLTTQEVETLKQQFLNDLTGYLAIVRGEANDPDVDDLLVDLELLFNTAFGEMTPELQNEYIKMLYSSNTLQRVSAVVNATSAPLSDSHDSKKELAARQLFAASETGTWEDILLAREAESDNNTVQNGITLTNIGLYLFAPGPREVMLIQTVTEAVGLIFGVRAIANANIPKYMTKLYVAEDKVRGPEDVLDLDAPQSIDDLTLTDAVSKPKVSFYADFVTESSFLATVVNEFFYNNLRMASRIDDLDLPVDFINAIENEYDVEFENLPIEEIREKAEDLIDKARLEDSKVWEKVPIDISHYDSIERGLVSFSLNDNVLDNDALEFSPGLIDWDPASLEIRANCFGSGEIVFDIFDDFGDTFEVAPLGLKVPFGEHDNPPVEVVSIDRSALTLTLKFPFTLPDGAFFDETVEAAKAKGGQATAAVQSDGTGGQDVFVTYKVDQNRIGPERILSDTLVLSVKTECSEDGRLVIDPRLAVRVALEVDLVIPPGDYTYDFTYEVTSLQNGKFFEVEGKDGSRPTMQARPEEEVGDIVNEPATVSIARNGEKWTITMFEYDFTSAGSGIVRELSVDFTSDKEVVFRRDNLIYEEYYTLTGGGTFNITTGELNLNVQERIFLSWSLNDAVSVSRLGQSWSGKLR